MKEVTIGTRGSRLALAQTELVAAELRRLYPEIAWHIEVIQTEGDRFRGAPLPVLGGQGVFIKELEEALLDGEIDLAVHSLKDMPTKQPEGLLIAAVLEREDPRDVLISREGLSLRALPKAARVGTGSPRRMAQLLAFRPDLRVLEVRGNVETRLRKLEEGRFDAILLAAAGLVRLGLASHITEPLPCSIMLPAVGQGALALEVREDDAEMQGLVQPLDHKPTRMAVEAERAFLRALEGGCRAPITAYGCVKDKQLLLEGLVARPDGTELFRDRLAGDPRQREELARRLARRLLRQGAEKILQEVRHG